MTDKREIQKEEELPPEPLLLGSRVNPKPEIRHALGEYLQDRFNSIKGDRERSMWEKEKADAFDAYHMAEHENKPLPYAGAANMTCILPRIGVDTYHANVMQSLFGKDNRLKVRTKWTPPGFQITGQKAANLLTFVLEHEVRLYEVFDDADLKAQVYGIGYLEPSYVRKKSHDTVLETHEETVPQINQQTGQVEFKTKRRQEVKKKERTVFDGVKVESLPVESIYVSPFVRDIDQAVEKDVLFKVFNLTVQQLDQRTRGDDPVYMKEEVESLKGYVTKNRLERLTDLEMAKARNDGFYMDRLIANENIDLAEAHLWYDIDGDDIPEKIMATFHPDTGSVVRVVMVPCRIVDLRPRPVDERFYGFGIPRIGKWIALEWEVTHNARMNAGQWENCPFGFYRAGGRLNMSEITVTPGHFYPVDDPREVQFAQTPSVRPSYFQEEQLLVNYFELLFGIPSLRPAQSRRSGSATRDIQDSQRAQIQFSNPLNREVLALTKLIGHVWDLCKEHSPKEKEYQIVGAGGVPIFDKFYKADYSVQMDFKVDVQTVFDQQQARDTALLVYRLLLGNPLTMQHPAVLYDLTKRTLDNLDFDISIPKPKEARTLSPYEEHEMFRNGELPNPQVGEDYEDHLKQHAVFLKSDEIREWPQEAVTALLVHISKTQIMKGFLETANLNQSGKFEGMPELPETGDVPGVTASRNPSQHFNTMRVGENTASSLANIRNNANGGKAGV